LFIDCITATILPSYLPDFPLYLPELSPDLLNFLLKFVPNKIKGHAFFLGQNNSASFIFLFIPNSLLNFGA